MEQRDSFIFYRSFYEALSECPDDVRLKLYDAIANYALNFQPAQLTGIGAALWTLIEPQIKANNKRYMNGKKGGAPQGNTNAKKEQPQTQVQPKNNQKTTKKQPNENENVNENENDIIESKVAKQPKRTRTRKANEFIPPTIEELSAYILEKGYTFSAEQFIAYYETRGWKLSNGVPMKNWKAGCVTWQARENNPKKITTNQGNNNGRNEHPTDEELVRQTYQIIAEADGKAEAGYYDPSRLPF